MNSNGPRRFLLVAGLAAGGVMFNSVAKLAAPAPADSGEGALPRFFGSTGAVRPVLADGCWLRAGFAWESADEAAVRAWLRLAVAADPESSYFRFNAARMTAFDFPAWRERREPAAPAAVREKWREELGEEAIAILGEGGQSARAGQWIEAGNIALYGQRKPLRAAEYYRRAALCADAPWHAGRICAELLRAGGRPGDAVAWLREWLPRVPADVPEAQRPLVEARLAELERELGRTEPF